MNDGRWKVALQTTAATGYSGRVIFLGAQQMSAVRSAGNRYQQSSILIYCVMISKKQRSVHVTKIYQVKRKYTWRRVSSTINSLTKHFGPSVVCLSARFTQ